MTFSNYEGHYISFDEYYDEYLKKIILDNEDEERMFSSEYIYKIYLENKSAFNYIMVKILDTNNLKLFADVLRSLIFTDIDFDNEYIINIMNVCINSSENFAISRVLTTLEILNNKKITNKFINVKIKSKCLAKRFKNLL
jgi:hypothetical protein